MKFKLAVIVIQCVIVLFFYSEGNSVYGQEVLLQHIKDELVERGYRGERLPAITTALAKAGYWEDALSIVENHLYPSDGLSYLALVAATLGDTERAMRLANTAFQTTDSMFEIGILAQVAVKLQDYNFVLKCIESATVRLEKLYDVQEIGVLVLDFFILMDVLNTITDDSSIIGENKRILPYLHRMGCKSKMWEQNWK